MGTAVASNRGDNWLDREIEKVFAEIARNREYFTAQFIVDWLDVFCDRAEWTGSTSQQKTTAVYDSLLRLCRINTLKSSTKDKVGKVQDDIKYSDTSKRVECFRKYS